MKAVPLVVLVALLVLAAGCRESDLPETAPDLSAWRVDHAPADVAAAVADRDYRVLSMMGIGKYTPGIADRDHRPTAGGRPVGDRCLGGSDVVPPGEVPVLRAMEAYAARYNRLMARYLAAHPNPPGSPASAPAADAD